MGSKPIHRRTDVPLEGKEKSQTAEQPSQPLTLEDSAPCFVRDVAHNVPLAKGCGCKNGSIPPLCPRHFQVVQETNPLQIKWGSCRGWCTFASFGMPRTVYNTEQIFPLALRIWERRQHRTAIKPFTAQALLHSLQVHLL